MSNLQQRAEAVIPGGVNSPVRAFRNVDIDPLYASHAAGSKLTTTEGTEFIDFCGSFGPMILGHAHPGVVTAIKASAEKGTSFAVTTEAEIEMAELLCESSEAIEKVRLVNSGTEAVMTALRLARGATGRNKILKFSGCYHGHTDSMLVEAGSGVAGISEASSAGVTAQAAATTLTAPYNDFDAVEKIMNEHGQDIAAIITEPVAANMGLILPAEGFLKHLRDLTTKHGSLLIFDEVINGFRLNYGAYSNQLDFKPDLTTLGKIIGGGLPIGAVGGKAEIMNLLAPEGPVYQAGTLSGNPASVAAGLTTLRELRSLNPYDELADKAQKLCEHIRESAAEASVTLSVVQLGGLFSLFFSEQDPHCFEDVMNSDKERFKPLFKSLLNEGVYLPPSAFETSFISSAHSDEDMQKTEAAFSTAFKNIA